VTIMSVTIGMQIRVLGMHREWMNIAIISVFSGGGLGVFRAILLH